MKSQNILALITTLAAGFAIAAPAAKPQYGDYGSYDVASYGDYPAEEVGAPTEYGSYGDYGAYKRDAKPEAAPIAEPEAKPQYGDYGDYGSYDVPSYGDYPAEEVGQPTEYGSYGGYGAYKREAKAEVEQ